MKAAFWTHRVHRLSRDFCNLGKIALGDPEDALCIVRAGYLLTEPCLVIVDVGPAKAVLKHRLLVELACEIHCACSLIGVEHNRFAVGLDFMSSKGPQQWVNPAVIIAEAMTQLEAERVTLGLELDACLEQFVP